MILLIFEQDWEEKPEDSENVQIDLRKPKGQGSNLRHGLQSEKMGFQTYPHLVSILWQLPMAKGQWLSKRQVLSSYNGRSSWSLVLIARDHKYGQL